MHRPSSRFATRALVLACAPALGVFLAFGSMASASTAHAAHTANSREAAVIAALKHFLAHQHGLDHAVGTVQGQTKVDSSNWSAYADTSSTDGTYSAVSGSWTEPTGTCTSSESFAAFWVGIDGYSSDTVEQDGTLIFCDGGSPTYYSWWEMYPSNDIQVVGDTVKPGDKISASVTRTGTSYALDLTDSTTSGNNVSETETCAATTCIDTSAEWIAERPDTSSGLAKLTDYGTWKVTGASVTSTAGTGTISSNPYAEITMVNGKTVLSKPGKLTDGGASFKTTWKSAG
jgi:hypothetical protein